MSLGLELMTPAASSAARRAARTPENEPWLQQACQTSCLTAGWESGNGQGLGAANLPCDTAISRADGSERSDVFTCCLPGAVALRWGSQKAQMQHRSRILISMRLDLSLSLGLKRSGKSCRRLLLHYSASNASITNKVRPQNEREPIGEPEIKSNRLVSLGRTPSHSLPLVVAPQRAGPGGVTFSLSPSAPSLTASNSSEPND